MIHKDWFPLLHHIHHGPVRRHMDSVEESFPKHLKDEMFKFMENSVESIRVVSIISTPKSKSSFIKDYVMYLPINLTVGYGENSVWEVFVRSIISLISHRKSCIWVVNKDCQEYISSIKRSFLIDGYNTQYLIDHIPLAYYNYVQKEPDSELEYKIESLMKRLNI